MVKRLMSWCLLFFMIFSLNRVYAQSDESVVIDPVFLNEISQLDAWIPVIIELKEDPSIEYWSNSQTNFQALPPLPKDVFSVDATQDYQTSLIYLQQDFLRWTAKQGLPVLPQSHITLVLNAIAAEVHSSSIPLLLQHSRVLFIHDDREKLQPLRATMAKTTGADVAWEGFSDISVNRLSGRNKLIGIIDTGLERHHAEFNRPRKVRGGYNFANNNSDISDPMGHGTHVTGIAAGQGNTQALRGMAYEADIMVYRVFSQNAQGARNVIPAIDRSVSDKCDVINLSLGYAGGENAKGSTAYHRSIANANKAGVFVVAAVGNDGSRRKEIPWTASSPSIVEEAFSVAALNDRKMEAFLTLEKGTPDEKKIQAIHADPSPPFSSDTIKKNIVFAEFGQKKDVEQVDLNGKIALIQRGPLHNPITFREKVENAMSKGAEGVILFNHTPYELFTPALLGENENPAQTAHLVSTIMITMEDGIYLKGLLGQNYNIEVTYQVSTEIADFSSMGPTPDAAFKPEIAAPGDNIRSTYKTAYAVMGGTSMASPSIAGLVALLKEAQPKWTHDQIKSALMNTADIAINSSNGLPITFLLQGSGSARVDKAIQTPAFIEPRALVYSNVKSIIEQEFTVQNAWNKKQSLSLQAELFLLEGEISPIEFELSSDILQIEAQKDIQFSAIFNTDPSKMVRNRYEGVIRIGKDLHVPFVIYRDSVASIEEPISNIRLSSNQLDLSSESLFQEKSVKIYFSLNAGTLLTVSQGGNSTNIGRNHGSVSISIVDDEGEVWANIARMYNVVAGEYAIEWSGKNQLNRYFLPRGEYFVSISMDKREYKNNQWVNSIYSTQRQAFQVIASDVPDPIPAVFSTLKTYKEFQEFKLDLSFGALAQQESIGTARVNTISFEFMYDSSRIMFRRYQLNGFLKQYQSEFDFEVDADDYEGIIRVHFYFDQMDSSFFTDEKSMSFIFRTIGTGRVRFSSKGFKIFLSNEEMVRVRPFMPSIRITNREFLLADLNNDLIVDRLDYAIFSQAYGSAYGDPSYHMDCDFNQDMIIDMYDFMIMSKELGKYI